MKFLSPTTFFRYFYTQDEATFSLSKNARMFIKGLGSSYINQLKWRGMWAFVVQRLDDRNMVYGESFQDSPEYNQWGKPVKLRTSVKLLAENIVNCNWGDSEVSRRRKGFCDKYEGYENVCNCEYQSWQSRWRQ